MSSSSLSSRRIQSQQGQSPGGGGLWSRRWGRQRRAGEEVSESPITASTGADNDKQRNKVLTSLKTEYSQRSGKRQVRTSCKVRSSARQTRSTAATAAKDPGKSSTLSQPSEVEMHMHACMHAWDVRHGTRFACG